MRLCLLFIVSLSFCAAQDPQAARLGKKEAFCVDPDYFGEPLATAAELGVDQQLLDDLEISLVQLAVSGRFSGRKRAELLATALAVNPESEPAYTANIDLKFGRKPPAEVLGKGLPADQLDQTPLRATYALGGKARDGKAKLLVSMLLDVCKHVHPDDRKLARTRSAYRKNNPEPPWQDIIQASQPSRSDGKVVLRQPGRDEPRYTGLGLRLPRLETSSVILAGGDKESRFIEPTKLTAELIETDARLSRAERFVFAARHSKTNNLGMPEVVNFLSLRHGNWLEAGKIEFSFDCPYPTDDGVVTSLGCALLMEGLITGQPVDDGICVLGTLNADGSVQPVPGIVERLRKAEENGVRIAIIPEANRYALTDLALLGEASVLANMQVFAVGDFDSAWRVANSERPAGLARAIADFERLQSGFDGAKVMKVVNSAQGKALVGKIVENAPNHASAKVMQQAANRTLPKTLSLNGSLEKLFVAYTKMMSAVVADDGQVDRLSASLAEFRRLQPRVEPRTRQLANVLTKTAADLMAIFRDGSTRERAMRMAQGHARALNEAVSKLTDDPEVIEDLGF